LDTTDLNYLKIYYKILLLILILIAAFSDKKQMADIILFDEYSKLFLHVVSVSLEILEKLKV